MKTTFVTDENNVITGLFAGTLVDVDAIPGTAHAHIIISDEFPGHLQDTIFISGTTNDDGEYTSVDVTDQRPQSGNTADYTAVGTEWVLADAAASAQFNTLRAAALMSSDWSQVTDSPLTDGQKTEVTTWRQQLRDATEGSTDPKVWLATTETLIETKPSFINIV